MHALKAGAAGYLLKSSLRTELIDVVRGVHRGHRHVPREVAEEIAAHVADGTLSERERDPPAGRDRRGDKQLAPELRLSEETIRGT